MVLAQFISELLIFLTLVSGIALVLFLVLIGINRNKENFISDIKNWVGKNSLWIGFIVTLVATLGSLFYSNIMMYEPCKLCWFQRIFMYPLPLLFGIAIQKKDSGVRKYAIPMAIIGSLISIYHYVQQIIEKSVGCDVGSAVDCAVKYTFDYGYITIPMMALTAFLVTIIVLLVPSESRKNKESSETNNY